MPSETMVPLSLYEDALNERRKANSRAIAHARYADRLEKILTDITECACTQQFTCASRALIGLEAAGNAFNLDWEDSKRGE